MDTWLEQSDGTRIPLTDGFSIGRGTENMLPLQDERASRRHALIHDRGKEGFWIVDLGSRNGTYRNNRRVQQPARLKHGDTIRVGSTGFTFLQPGTEGLTTNTVLTRHQTIMEVRSEDCWLLIGDLEGSTQMAQKLDPSQVAALTSGWLKECRKLIESTGGMINKFLGDGFFGFWRATESPPEKIVGCLRSLRQLQQAEAMPRFRLVLHRGQVHIGGGATFGEENLAGPEVNFAFRMEKLAGSLGETLLVSPTAAASFKGVCTVENAGDHPLPGYEGSFRFFRLGD